MCDAGLYLDKAAKAGKNILFEAQLGALQDIDFGIYPYTSSSNVIGAYAPVGAGIPNHKIDLNIGIMKAYSSCVGEGPFTCELFGEEAEKLRKAGGEYGAATGRPRRVGPFDVVASRYGCRAQGADEIALTKLDILDTLDEIPVTVAYELDGQEIHDFPYGDVLEQAKPINKNAARLEAGHLRRRKGRSPCSGAGLHSFPGRGCGCENPLRIRGRGARPVRGSVTTPGQAGNGFPPALFFAIHTKKPSPSLERRLFSRKAKNRARGRGCVYEAEIHQNAGVQKRLCAAARAPAQSGAGGRAPVGPAHGRGGPTG